MPWLCDAASTVKQCLYPRTSWQEGVPKSSWDISSSGIPQQSTKSMVEGLFVPGPWWQDH